MQCTWVISADGDDSQIPLLPRSLAAFYSPDRLEDIDWTRLSDVRWLLDRSNGLSQRQKRDYFDIFGRQARARDGSTSSYSSSARSSAVSRQSFSPSEADELRVHLGSDQLPPVYKSHSELVKANCRPLQVCSGLFPELQRDSWVLYHHRGDLLWGDVRAIYRQRFDADPAVRLRTCKVVAGLTRGEARQPNLVDATRGRVKCE